MEEKWRMSDGIKRKYCEDIRVRIRRALDFLIEQDASLHALLWMLMMPLGIKH